MSDTSSNLMLLYKNISPLSRDDHRRMKLKPVADFACAMHTHWLPVAGVEFFEASRSHPILFASQTRDGQEEIVQMLLVGLDVGRNDQMDAAGQWKAGSYLPAFVRSYPFVLAGTPNQGQELTVCFDNTYAGFNEIEGWPLFNDDGTPSAQLGNTLQFLHGFAQEMERTRLFIAELVRLGLLERLSVQISNGVGEHFNLENFLVVSEARLAKLKGSDLAALNKAGFLGWIYAHLISLGNLPTLLELRTLRMKGVPQPQ
jgi:hypothetical protein